MTYEQGKYILTEEARKKYLGSQPDNIIFRSGWERYFMHYLSNNPSVLAWSSEEIIISYYNPVRNKISRYFMDFWVRVKDKNNVIKQILVEVKPFDQTQEPRISGKRKSKKKIETLQKQIMTYSVNIAKWKATVEFCKKNELEFYILTEDKQKMCGFKLWHWSELLRF